MPTQMRDRIVVAVGELYDIREELGRGGMALVFRAIDLRLRRAVAIKVLPPELAFNADVRTRFLREAQTAAQLSHPNIVPIYSVDEKDGISYIVMGLVDGESLAATLRRDEQMPIETIRRILGEVADALDFAHRHGVIHRDVKPDNILLDKHSGRAMVTDFGIARAAAEDSRLTVTGIAIGTPAYMSPEQALGEREVDGRSDLYSLGIVGYQMLTGEPPFKANNTPSMLMKHIAEEPRGLRERRPDAPAALVNAIHRALAKRPEDRWPDAAAFRAAISAAHVEPFQQPAAMVPPSLAPNLAPPAAPMAKWYDGPMNAPAEPFPALSIRDYLKEGRQQMKRELKREIHRRYRDDEPLATDDKQLLEERITRFRRQFFTTVGILGLLTWINASSHGPPWIILPFIGMGFGVMRRWAPLGRARLRFWDVILEGEDAPELAEIRREKSDPRRISIAIRERFKLAVGFGGLSALIFAVGSSFHFDVLIPAFVVSSTLAGLNSVLLVGNLWRSLLRKVGRRGIIEEPVPAKPIAPPKSLKERAAEDARRRVSGDVLDGPRGAAVIRACEDRLIILGVVDTLQADDRALIPDVAPTADSLVERVASLAQTVHRLDSDGTPENLARLDARLAELQSNGTRSAVDRERHRALLERQRTTVQDLVNRRDQLVAQLENAAIVLANLRLDLIKLRSAGIGSALDDVNSATQEARALSRDIGNVLDAASEIRSL